MPYSLKFLPSSELTEAENTLCCKSLNITVLQFHTKRGFLFAIFLAIMLLF